MILQGYPLKIKSLTRPAKFFLVIGWEEASAYGRDWEPIVVQVGEDQKTAGPMDGPWRVV